MIKLILLGEDYEQDIRPLVSAFYPEEIITVIKTEEKECVEQPFLQIILYLLEQSFQITLTGTEAPEKTLSVSQKVTLFGEMEEKKRAYRIKLHRSLYQILSEWTKKTLPWGTLTGVRPVKLVLDKLEQGIKEEKICDFMKETYLCSKEKISICLEIAKREREILDVINEENSYSLYLGIPFCPTTCAYCSFPSYPLEHFSKLVEPYLEALYKEILYTANRMRDRPLKTIYFGGGTPTTLTSKQLKELLKFVWNSFDCSKVEEFTVEAGRPDSITREKLEVLKEENVTRISINPQSMQQKTLDLIGRRHTAKQIEEAFFLAREVGHENINMDLIIGLPGETPEDVAYTLSRIKTLDPDSLTVHTLARKRAARLNTQKEQYMGLKAKEVGKMQELTSQFAKENGYFPYYLYRQKHMEGNLENIGYAKKGKEGIYNILIMEERQTILALGSGATSKFVFPKTGQIERVENVKSLTDYITRIDEMIQRKQMFYQQYGQ